MMRSATEFFSEKVTLQCAHRAAFLVVVLSLSACASTTQGPSINGNSSGAQSSTNAELLVTPRAGAETTPRSVDDVALDDLTRALVQYRNPITTTLQAGLNLADIDDSGLLALLAKHGYGLQLVDADQGANLLSHEVDTQGSGDSEVARHTLRVGRLELEREYTRVNGQARPAGPLSVAGSRRRIVLDDSRFGDSVAKDRLISRIAFSASSDVEPGDTPRISLLQLPLAASDGNNTIGTNASGLEVSNAFFGDDNFGSILNDYDKLETVNVIFPNDSMRLGNIGRLKIDVFLGDFEEDSDLIRVVGCSNGHTNAPLGNQGLALGRAERVTQELLARGVTREHILDEGCWAPTSAGDRFPSRGVVLEMYRES